MAIFPYDAQQDDELSFPADAILEILDPENASGWFKARLNDRVGLIPSTYVQSLDVPQQRKKILSISIDQNRLYLLSRSMMISIHPVISKKE
jgi:Variant SH3 domain